MEIKDFGYQLRVEALIYSDGAARMLLVFKKMCPEGACVII